MSKNYELLQQASRQKEFFPPHASELRNSVEGAANECRYDADLYGLEKDEVTKLVRQLFCRPEPVESRSVVFASPEQGSGCSWVITRAAKVLASLRAGSVCLVDANLRSPSLHREFGLSNDYGLADAASRLGPAREFAQCVSGGNLWVMSSGSFESQNSARLTSDAIYEYIAELRKEFDYIIIDAPPLNISSDAVLLGLNSDGLVLILKANVSRRDTAQKALRDLAAAQVRVLGTVLNQRTFPLPAVLYKRL